MQTQPRLSPTQKKVLSFIENFLEANEEAPTVFELQNHLGLRTVSKVYQHLHALESKGYLSRQSKLKQGINYVLQVGNHVGEYVRIPMVGSIVAGYPLEALSEITEYVTLPGTNFKADRKYFALRVCGTSMLDNNVFDGDIVIVEQVQEVHNGDMVVALLQGGEATLKHFYLEKDGMVRLQPANSDYKPIFAHISAVSIQGRVVRVIRDYKNPTS